MQTNTSARGARIEVGHELLEDVELRLPPGWFPVQSGEEADVWRNGSARLELRVRREPAFALEVAIANEDSESPVEVDSPILVVRTRGPQLPWLGGATARVLLPAPTRSAVFRQVRGQAGIAPGGDAKDGITLFRDAVWLRPGQTTGAAWRLEGAPDGGLPADPAWLPIHRHVPLGEGVRLDAPDAAVLSRTVTDHMVGEVEVLLGPAGVHDVGLVDARGTTFFEVGWYAPLVEIAAEARAMTRRADLAAWLTVATGDVVDDEAALDELDANLGEALERPSVWGVLAALHVGASTELPVRDEAEEAARRLMAVQPTSELAPILVGLGIGAVGPGRQGAQSTDWWDVLARDDADLVQRVLDRIDHGRITSLPPAGMARGLALASLWLATHERAAGASRVLVALEDSFARLLAANSARPDPTEVAWLLLAEQWR